MSKRRLDFGAMGSDLQAILIQSLLYLHLLRLRLTA